MNKLLGFLFFICCCSLHAQSVIFVSPHGDDVHGDGTKTHPYATLRKAYQKGLGMKGTDTLTIHLSAGHYELVRPILLTETPQRPFLIEGDKVGKTVLSGGKRIKGWMKGPGNSWVAYVEEAVRYGWNFEQLYVNGERAIRARTPDRGGLLLDDAEEWKHFDGKGKSTSLAMERYHVQPTDLQSLQGIGYESSNRMVANFYHKWSITRRHVAKAVAETGSIYTSGIPWESWNPIGRGSRLVLENYKNALTMPGEWFLDSDGTLFYIPREGEDIRNLEVYAPALENLLVVRGQENRPVQHLTFRYLNFEHAAYRMPNTGNAPVQAAADISAAVEVRNATDVHFQNCSVRHTGNYALSFGRQSSHCSLEHSLLTDLGAGGVKIGETNRPSREKDVVRDVRITNNIIQGTGKVFASAVGVAIFHASDNKVLHNELSDMMYTAVSVGWTWGYGNSHAVNNEIGYNHIHHIGWGVLSDMGGIYTLGKSPGTHIHHNVIHDICSYDYGGWGIYADEGSSDIVIENNLVYRCKSGAFHQHYGRDNMVRNNIFAFSRIQQLQLSKVEAHRSFTFTNNIVLGKVGKVMEGPWQQAQPKMGNNLYWYADGSRPDIVGITFEEWVRCRDRSSIWADPLFVNPQGGDFRIADSQNVRKIGFRPFDYTQAGVVGEKAWRKKAELSPLVIKQFEMETKERMNIATR